jgi:hypothetical protein
MAARIACGIASLWTLVGALVIALRGNLLMPWQILDGDRSLVRVDGLLDCSANSRSGIVGS